MGGTLAYKDLCDYAENAGLGIFGIAPPKVGKHVIERFQAWQGAGLGGGMNYLYRAAEGYGDGAKLLDGVRSVVSVALRYDAAPHPPHRPGYGRVARYAWGRDYHQLLPARLAEFVRGCQALAGSSGAARICTDAVPLLERAFAAEAGIGFVGKNTLIIRPGEGSLFFLAEVLWDLEIVDIPPVPAFKGCGSCTRCGSGCPTGALDTPYQLDARRCISYLTIEKRGALEVWERRAVGEWLFGCDICQDVCPFNHTAIKRARKADLPDLQHDAGAGALLPLEELLALRSQASFRERFAGTPLLRAKREGLARSAACVAANTNATELIPNLLQAVAEDESPVVRSHALWAVHELNSKSGGAHQGDLSVALALVAKDEDPLVVEERARCTFETMRTEVG